MGSSSLGGSVNEPSKNTLWWFCGGLGVLGRFWWFWGVLEILGGFEGFWEVSKVVVMVAFVMLGLRR